MKTAAKIKEELSQPNEKSDAKQDRILTYSMVQSPSWEANWFAASQEIPRISRPEGSLPHSQASGICPYTHIPPPGDPS